MFLSLCRFLIFLNFRQTISIIVLKSILHMTSTQFESKKNRPFTMIVAASHTLCSVVFDTKTVTNRWNTWKDLFLSASTLHYM